MRVWEKLSGESAPAYRAYALYRDLGPGRSLRQVAEILYGGGYQSGAKRVPGRLKTWSAENDWGSRTAAYDAMLEPVAQDAIAQHVRSRATSFEERRRRLQETRLEVADLVVERIREMASSPLYTETSREDTETGEVTVVKTPAGWSFTTISRLDAVVGAIAGNVGPEVVVAWDTLSEAELERILAGENVRAVRRLAQALGIEPRELMKRSSDA